MNFSNLKHKERRSRLITAIQLNVLFHKNNKEKSRLKDEFSFLVNPTFKWQYFEVPDSLSVIAKRKKQYVLVGLGLFTLIMFGYFFVQTLTGEIDNVVVLFGSAFLTIILIAVVMMSFFVRTNDFELTFNGIIFGNKILVPYQDLVLIHFRKTNSEPIPTEYLVFRFINRPKKEININQLPYEKTELGELIYAFLQLNIGLKEDEVLDRE